MKRRVEVVLYINKLKDFMEKYPDSTDYFFNNGNENNFYDLVSELATENLIENGSPELTIEQFQFIKNKIDGINTFFISLN